MRLAILEISKGKELMRMPHKINVQCRNKEVGQAYARDDVSLETNITVVHIREDKIQEPRTVVSTRAGDVSGCTRA
jgi:hypothetical protein